MHVRIVPTELESIFYIKIYFYKRRKHQNLSSVCYSILRVLHKRKHTQPIAITEIFDKFLPCLPAIIVVILQINWIFIPLHWLMEPYHLFCFTFFIYASDMLEVLAARVCLVGTCRVFVCYNIYRFCPWFLAHNSPPIPFFQKTRISLSLWSSPSLLSSAHCRTLIWLRVLKPSYQRVFCPIL